MFFLASKLTGFLASPLVWVLGVLVWGVLARPGRRKRRLLRTGIAALLLLSNDLLSNLALHAWNAPAVAVARLPPGAGCAIVLGGFTIQNQLPADRTYLNQAADRLMHAILLYREGRVQYILITGGSGSLRAARETEAYNAHRLLRLCQVPDSAILLEQASRNTYQNARFTRALLARRGLLGASHVLVTSAWHMPRARRCFQKQQVPVVPFATDFRAQPGRFQLDALLIPSLEALGRWDVLFHEWLGFAIYWAQGYI